MNKKILGLIIVVSVIVGGVFFVINKNQNKQISNKQISSDYDRAEIGGKTQKKLFEIGNPFEVDVNPFRGYKNPFAK